MQNTGNSSCWGIARVYVDELGFVFVGGAESSPRDLFAMQIGLSVGRGGLLSPSIHIDPQFVILREAKDLQ